jgi:hypothetical protein
MLDRTLNVRAAPPALALVGIFEPVEPAAGRECNDTEVAVDVDAAAAARCAPSLAITREREMRGLRAYCCGLVDARSGLVVERPPEVARALAAAVSEVGRTGGGTASSGVLNILLACPPHGLFVIASRAELRGGGVLARCATMLPVLDLATAPVAVGLRVFARELAVGANSLEVGLNMVAAALLLPSAALSSSALFVVFVALFVGPGTARRCCDPADNEFVADERGRPTLPFVPKDDA